MRRRLPALDKRRNYTPFTVSNRRIPCFAIAEYYRDNRLDLPELKEKVSLLRRSSNNLNQIAKRVNETSRIYGADIDCLKGNQERIWTAANEILEKLAEIKLFRNPCRNFGFVVLYCHKETQVLGADFIVAISCNCCVLPQCIRQEPFLTSPYTGQSASWHWCRWQKQP